MASHWDKLTNSTHTDGPWFNNDELSKMQSSYEMVSSLTTANNQLAQACHEFMDEAGKSVALLMENTNVCQLINNRKVEKHVLGKKKKQSERASLYCMIAKKSNI